MKVGKPIENLYSNLTQAKAGKFSWVTFFALIKAMRPHQWSKNTLLILPLILAHELDDLGVLQDLALGLICFSLAASAVYLVNDIVDVEVDRKHPEKCFRPLASGALSKLTAGVFAVAFMGISFMGAWFLSSSFFYMLGGYFVVTNLYSLVLKKEEILDVLCLAILYVWRILAGAALAEVEVSFWLLAFSLFLFLSLALAKRATEIISLKDMKIPKRGYYKQDLSLIINMGVVSGFGAMIILTMYLHSPKVLELYSQPQLLWVNIVFLIYWISRLWLKAARGKLHHDPIVFALKDKVSYFVALGVFLSGFLAS